MRSISVTTQVRQQRNNNARVDYKSAMFVGQTSERNRRHGSGILLTDDNFMLISDWSDDKLDGNVLVFTPIGSIIYA